MDLGATPFYTLRKVIIPEIMPGIITGGLMAFTLSIDDFVISFFNTGNGVTNLSISIFAMSRKGINPIINALSTLMFISMIVLLLIINKRNSKNLERGA
jgi:spermidine/putrescine transport system permease protein